MNYAIKNLMILIRYKNTCRVIINNNQNKILKETVKSNQRGNMPHTFPVIPMDISDPAFLKRKVLLAKDAGYDHDRVLVN